MESSVMEEAKFKDLLEDEELTSLRLAALATKRKKEQNVNISDSTVAALPINSIVTSSANTSESISNQIPFLQSDRNAFNNSYSWRKQNQSSRRRGGIFSKNNHRSNLIVISPVSLNDEKDSQEKVPPLLLPQHKWCNSGNEDSMSPKTLRRTGPTRFNRHGSDSESSESDYENNDSGSNETVLQDEPPEHFTCLSPGSDVVSDGVEKKRRLSFQNLESEIKTDDFDKNETTCIYNLLKNPSYDSVDNKQDNYASAQNPNDSRNTWNHAVENEYAYKQFNNEQTYTSNLSDSTEKFVRKQINSSVVGNGESRVDACNFMTQSSDMSTWQHAEIKSDNSYYSRKTSSISENSRNHGISDRKLQNFSEKRQISSESSDNIAWQHGEGLRANRSFFSGETAYNAAEHRNYSNENLKSQFLSEGDLRLELKKRMQEVKSKVIENQNDKIENKRYGQSTWDRNRQKSSYETVMIDDVSYTNSYGNKQECSNLQRSRQERSYSREKDDHNSNVNHRRHQRSLSRERSKQEICSSRDRSRFGYSSGPERSRYDRSSSRGRSRHERSSSRCRSRHDRSSSRGRNRHERSSSRNRSRHERSSSRNRSRHEHSPSQDRMKHERIQDSSRHECSSSPSKGYYEHSFSQDKSRPDYVSSQNRSRFERSSSRNKSRRENSSSSDSRHDRSLSQDRSRFEYSSRSRSKREHSINQERKRCEHNLSPDKSGHESSESEDSRQEHIQIHERNRCEDSSSHYESEDEHSSSQSRSKHKHTLRSTTNAYKHRSRQHKNRHDVISSQDRQECISDQEMLKDCNNSLEIRKTESVGENSKHEKDTTKQLSKSEESRFKHSSSEEGKKEVIKKPLRKCRASDSAYKNRRSRSRSSSSTSYSSSSSSSPRPKIRSVPSVVSSIIKSLDSQNRETSSEIKSVGKSNYLNNSQSDVSSTSTKRNMDVGDYNKLSNIKCTRVDMDFKASDNSKRVPVHMRLGALPRKRLIQMPKDVEAAFVNSSSSSSDGENVNTKCKRQNIRIVTDVYNAKSGTDSEKKHSAKEKSLKRACDLYQEKSKHVKIKR